MAWNFLGILFPCDYDKDIERCEPEFCRTDVIFRFEILSDLGKNIKKILEEQLKKPSEFIHDFTPIYKINENDNFLELELIKSPYKVHHQEIIELLNNYGLFAGSDYKIDWIWGYWSKKTKEFCFDATDVFENL